MKALLDDGLDTLQELLEAIPQDSRQLSCEELVPRLRKALGQAKTCGKLEQQIRIWRNHDRLSRPAAARG